MEVWCNHHGRMEPCFFKTMLLFPRPLSTRNWQIFALKFWNTLSTHLIWPLS
jgi:hypothetical protein